MVRVGWHWVGYPQQACNGASGVQFSAGWAVERVVVERVAVGVAVGVVYSEVTRTCENVYSRVKTREQNRGWCLAVCSGGVERLVCIGGGYTRDGV